MSSNRPIRRYMNRPRHVPMMPFSRATTQGAFPPSLLPSSAPPPLPGGNSSSGAGGSKSVPYPPRRSNYDRGPRRSEPPQPPSQPAAQGNPVRRPPPSRSPDGNKSPLKGVSRTTSATASKAEQPPPPPGGGGSQPRPQAASAASDLARTDRARTSVAASRLPGHANASSGAGGGRGQGGGSAAAGPVAGSTEGASSSKGKKSIPSLRAPEPAAADAPTASGRGAASSGGGGGGSSGSNKGSRQFGFGALPPNDQGTAIWAARDASLPTHMRSLQEERRMAAQVWSNSRRMGGGWLEPISMKTESQPTAATNGLAASFHFILARAPGGPPQQLPPPESAYAPTAAVTLPFAGVHLFSRATIGPKASETFIWPKPVTGSWKASNTFWEMAKAGASDVEPPPPKRARIEPSPTSGGDTSRTWPSGCRFLVLWGFETSTATHRSHSAHIEQCVNQIRNSAPYVKVFGSPRGFASVQGVGTVDRREAPFTFRGSAASSSHHRGGPSNDGGDSMRALLSPSAAGETGGSAQNTAFNYRSLFSAKLVQDPAGGGGWKPRPKQRRGNESISFGRNAVISSTNSPISAPQSHRADQVLSAMMEFEFEDQARNFFIANAHSALTDMWCTRIWSAPDFDGIRYWLHTVLANSSTWQHAALPPFPEAATLKEPSEVVYAPFLSDSDLDGFQSGDITMRPLRGPALGKEFSVADLKLLRLPPIKNNRPQTPRSPTSNVPQRVPLLCHKSMVNWATKHLNAAEATWQQTSWVRVPKYICRHWGSATTAPTNPTDNPRNEEPPSPSHPRAYVARVALLLCPPPSSASNLPTLTPVVCGSLDELLNCQLPVVYAAPRPRPASPTSNVVPAPAKPPPPNPPPVAPPPPPTTTTEVPRKSARKDVSGRPASQPQQSGGESTTITSGRRATQQQGSNTGVQQQRKRPKPPS